MTAFPMKIEHLKIFIQRAKKLLGILAISITAFLGLSAPAQGQSVDQFWTGGTDFTPTHAASGEWTTTSDVLNWSDTRTSTGNSNWTNGNIAHFLDPTSVTVTLTSDITAAGINFESGAGPFIIHTSGSTLTLQGVGIVNNSGTIQTIVNDNVESDGVVFMGRTIFRNSATASDVTITNSGAGASTEFHNTSSAANATITNSGLLSRIEFFDTSSAGNATLINGSLSGGVLLFHNTSNAANAAIVNRGIAEFSDSSSGGNARLINANENGLFDISGLTTGGTTAGSIEGNGTFFLGSKNLTVGGNQLSTTFSGVISDFEVELGNLGGSLTKVGAGTLTLTGANDYVGATSVDGGSLIVDGSIASVQTSISPGGLLGGTGMIGGNVVNSGIVSPGNSAGTLTIINNYTQSAGGTLRIEIGGLGATEHDLLMIARTANLGGTLQILRLNNFQLHAGDQITFLAANGGVNGTFATIQNDFSTSGTIVGTEIIYLSNSVVLEGTQGSFEEVGETICMNPNDAAVGAALDSAVGDPRVAGLIEFLNSESLMALCRDLDLIAPEELTSMFNVSISIANIQTENLERRMNNIRAGSTGFSATGFSINTRGHDLSLAFAGPTGPEGKSGPSVMQSTPENRWGVFVTATGEFTNVDDTDITRGFDLSTGGVTFGVDYRVCPNFAIGLTGGYAHTSGNLTDNGSLDVDGGKIGVYATAFSGGFYVDTAATGGFNDYETRRTALLGTASGDTEGREFTGLVSAGYDWKSGPVSIGPIASFQYTYVEFDGFTEHGSLVPLAFDDQSAESSRTALGAKASYDWQMGHVLVRPEIRAAWQHEFGDRDYSLVSRFANGAGSSFTVTGPAIGRESLLVGAGAAVIFNDRVSAYAYYDGELARTNYSSHNVSAGVRVTF
jgi:autotransporter-associated beta strand protein